MGAVHNMWWAKVVGRCVFFFLTMLLGSVCCSFLCLSHVSHGENHTQVNIKFILCLNCSKYINCIGTSSVFKTKHYSRTECTLNYSSFEILLVYLLSLDKTSFVVCWWWRWWWCVCACTCARVPIVYLNYYFQYWASFRVHTSRADYKSTMNPFIKLMGSY